MCVHTHNHVHTSAQVPAGLGLAHQLVTCALHPPHPARAPACQLAHAQMHTHPRTHTCTPSPTPTGCPPGCPCNRSQKKPSNRDTCNENASMKVSPCPHCHPSCPAQPLLGAKWAPLWRQPQLGARGSEQSGSGPTLSHEPALGATAAPSHARGFPALAGTCAHLGTTCAMGHVHRFP